jgi:hypothetical protein
MRQLDAAHLGILRRMAGFQVIDIGVGGHRAGVGDQPVQRRAGARQDVGIQQIRHHQVAGLMILLDIPLRDHALLPCRRC